MRTVQPARNVNRGGHCQLLQCPFPSKHCSDCMSQGSAGATGSTGGSQGRRGKAIRVDARILGASISSTHARKHVGVWTHGSANTNETALTQFVSELARDSRTTFVCLPAGIVKTAWCRGSVTVEGSRDAQIYQHLLH